MTPLALVAVDALAACRSIRGAREVSSLDDVERELCALGPSTAASLDLYAHTTRGHHHLRFGCDVVDALDHRIASRFAALVADGVLARAGIGRLRLLGCATALGPAARASLARLAHVTGLPVIGTRRALLAAHHGPDGFRPEFARVLETFVPAANRTRWDRRRAPPEGARVA